MSIGNNYKLAALSAEDKDWIAKGLPAIKLYIESRSGQKLTDIPTPKQLDEYIEFALKEMDHENIVGIFGTGFGDYFVQKAGFEWVLFMDEYGTDLAVHNKTTGVFGFPISSARKRVDDPTAGRFDAIYTSLTAG